MTKKKRSKKRSSARSVEALEQLLKTEDAETYGRVCWYLANRGTERYRAGDVINLDLNEATECGETEPALANGVSPRERQMSDRLDVRLACTMAGPIAGSRIESPCGGRCRLGIVRSKMMPLRLRRLTVALALFAALAVPVRGRRLLEIEGVELRGVTQLALSGGGTCNVLESDTSYEARKENHGARWTSGASTSRCTTDPVAGSTT